MTMFDAARSLQGGKLDQVQAESLDAILPVWVAMFEITRSIPSRLHSLFANNKHLINGYASFEAVVSTRNPNPEMTTGGIDGVKLYPVDRDWLQVALVFRALNMWCNPSAIFSTISLGWVFTINLMGRARSWPHVRQERNETVSPLIRYADAFRPVLGVILVCGRVASRLYSKPSFVFKAFARARFMAMDSRHLSLQSRQLHPVYRKEVVV